MRRHCGLTALLCFLLGCGRQEPVGLIRDQTPPGVVGTYPAPGTSGVPRNTGVGVAFDEPMDWPSVVENLSLSQGTPADVGWFGTALSFRPSVLLAETSRVTLTIGEGCRDLSQNPLGRAYTLEFQTSSAVDSLPPAVSGTSPGDGEARVSISSPLHIYFSERMDPSATGRSVSVSPVLIGNPSWPNDSTLEWVPLSPLPWGETIQVKVSRQARDQAWNPLESEYVFTFSTEEDTAHPHVVWTYPADGAVSVPVNSTVKIAFSKAMDTVSVRGAFSIEPAQGGVFSWNGNEATYRPSANLAALTAYRVMISTQARDVAGNQLLQPFSLGFVTGSAESPGAVLFVACSDAGTVEAIDLGRGLVTRQASGLAEPEGLALSPDGRSLYVAEAQGGAVAVLNTSDLGLRARIPVGDSPRHMAFSPDGTHLFVTNTNTGTISVVRAENDSVVGTIWGLGAQPTGIVVRPGSGVAYIANSGSSFLSLVNTQSQTVMGSTIPVGVHPDGLSIHPQGGLLYAANTGSSNLSVVNLAQDREVWVTREVLSGPREVAVSPDGERVFVSCTGGDQVWVMDAYDYSEVARVATSSSPWGLLVSPDGDQLFVANSGSNSVSAFDTKSFFLKTTFAVGPAPHYLAYLP